MAYWLGIDIGTGGSRALLIDAKGGIAGAVTAAHDEMTMKRPLWAEQDPDNWWSAAQKAIQGVLRMAGVSGHDIQGIGLSGQMHGSVLLDGSGAVVRPALIWCDQRSQPQVDAINQKLGAGKAVEYTANPILTGFTLPKILWVREHEPRNFARVRHVLLPKDHVRLRLTGEFATDVSDASGTAMFDVVGRKWSHQVMDGLGLDRALLPRAYESSEVTGVIAAPAAKSTGLMAGTPVVTFLLCCYSSPTGAKSAAIGEI